jgi:hypothetical protein
VRTPLRQLDALSFVRKTIDDLDRVVAWDAVPGTGVVGDTDASFQYDALDRLTQAEDDDFTVTFTYGSLSTVLSETQGANPLGTTRETVSYAHDDGNLTKVVYPSVFEAHRSYYTVSRLKSVVDHNTDLVASFALHRGGGSARSVSDCLIRTTRFAYIRPRA